MTSQNFSKEIYRLDLATRVTSFELLDSRWNGNEVLRYSTDKGSLFVKMNRVEDKSVFVAEAVGLTSILRTQTVAVPRPLHVGTLPKVGVFGPGAFLIAEYLQLVCIYIHTYICTCICMYVCMDGWMYPTHTYTHARTHTHRSPSVNLACAPAVLYVRKLWASTRVCAWQ